MVRYKNRPYCPLVQKNGQCNVCHEPDQILNGNKQTVLWEMVVCWNKIIFRHISSSYISFLSSSVYFYMKQFKKCSTDFHEILENFKKHWWAISKFNLDWTCLVTLHEDQYMCLHILQSIYLREKSSKQ
jgi:hypothetical protein